MRYLLYTLLLGCLVFSAAWAYRVNYETRDVLSNLKDLQIEIAKQQDERSMLEGEWSYLNRPERLSLLVERFFSHLMLMPMSAENFAEVDAIKIMMPKKLNLSKDKHILDEAKVENGDVR